jgi:hypothetical protein
LSEKLYFSKKTVIFQLLVPVSLEKNVVSDHNQMKLYKLITFFVIGMCWASNQRHLRRVLGK